MELFKGFFLNYYNIEFSQIDTHTLITFKKSTCIESSHLGYKNKNNTLLSKPKEIKSENFGTSTTL